MKNVSRAFLVMIIAALSFGLVLATFSNASAAGQRELAGGKYGLNFGFTSEPPVAGVQNTLEFQICQGACRTGADGKLQNPVKDANKTLKAQVSFGVQNMEIELAPRPGFDGSYTAAFIPAKIGDYNLRLFGTLNGDAIDEKINAGANGISPVVDAKMFPTGSGYTPQSVLENQLKEAKHEAEEARTFGYIALAVAIFALFLGFASIVIAGSRRGRRSNALNLTREHREPAAASKN
jgi:hypothetical protein